MGRKRGGVSRPRGLPELGKLRPDPVPRLFRQRHERSGQADRDLEFGHFAVYTMCSQQRSQESRSGEAIERCWPWRAFYGLRRQCIFSLIRDFSQTTELRQVHDDR